MPQPGHSRTLRFSGQFELDRAAYFYRRGLRFAHLGQRWRYAGAAGCYDSGPFRSKGDAPASAQSWNATLNRPQWAFTGGAPKIVYDCNPIIGTGPWSVSAWVWPDSGGAWDGPIVTWGDSGVAHSFVEVNCDLGGYLHVDQAAAGNVASFLAALTPDAWNHILYAHRNNSPVNGDSLWVNGVAAAASGVGSTALNIQPGGGDTLAIGESNSDSAFYFQGYLADVMLFDQTLGLQDAVWLSSRDDTAMRGLITDGLITNTHDLEHVR